MLSSTIEITRFLQGLEVIEAHYLFGAEYDDIEIVIHPQSLIHSMIETQVRPTALLFLFSKRPILKDSNTCTQNHDMVPIVYSRFLSL